MEGAEIWGIANRLRRLLMKLTENLVVREKINLKTLRSSPLSISLIIQTIDKETNVYFCLIIMRKSTSTLHSIRCMIDQRAIAQAVEFFSVTRNLCFPALSRLLDH